MGLKKQNLTLPEWAFLDAHNQFGNLLDGRDVLLHVRTHTMMEIFSLDETTLELFPGVKKRNFTYTNSLDIPEKHCLAVHYSLAEFTELDEVLDKAVQFYCDYLSWEDINIIESDTSKHN